MSLSHSITQRKSSHSSEPSISSASRHQTAVCIFSAAYSGSTLLSLMLGAHPKALYIGEFHAWPTWLARDHDCGCGIPIRSCNFWSSVSQRYCDIHGFEPASHPERLHIDLTHDQIRKGYIWRTQKALEYIRIAFPLFQSIQNPITKGWRFMVRDTLAFYNIIFRTSGLPVLVDSTKSYLRIYNLCKVAPSLIKVVFLIRDGRGVCFSNMERHNSTMGEAAKLWKNTYKRGQKVLSRLPSQNLLVLKYEDICINLQTEAMKLANFLSLEYSSSMLELSQGLGHSVAGNEMKWKPGNRITLNERWRYGLSSRDLKIFETVAGNLNRGFGYIE